MHYCEYAPWPSLAHAVQCLWTLEGYLGSGSRDAQPVLPDGRAELILHFGHPFDRVSDNGHVDAQAAALFAGQIDGQLLLRPSGTVSVLGVRFRPDGAAAFVRVPQHDLFGETLDLYAVLPGLAQDLADVRNMVSTATEAIGIVQSRLVPFCCLDRIDAHVRLAVDRIGRHRGRVSIDALAVHVGVTRRHLERRFRDQVGISPKRLARLARFQHALGLIDRPDSRRQGAQTAATCGYADQSHFVREFRELTGHSPDAYLLTRAALTGVFTEKV